MGEALTTSYASELWRRREFTSYLALGNIQARNASTALGLFWWVLSPMLLGITYFFVFGIIFRAARDPDYYPYLFSGIFVFYYSRGALLGSSATILSNAKLMTNLRFPRLSLVLAGLFESTFGFLASLVVFFLLTVPAGHLPGLTLLALPLVILLHMIFNLGLAAVAARLTIPFRDVKNLLPYALRLWLYLSPVVYTLDRVPEEIRWLMYLNPLTSILDLYRWVLMSDSVAVLSWSVALAWSTLVGVLGVFLFVRAEATFVRHL